MRYKKISSREHLGIELLDCCVHEILNVTIKADILTLGSFPGPSNRNFGVVKVTQAYRLEIELEQLVCIRAGSVIYY